MFRPAAYLALSALAAMPAVAQTGESRALYDALRLGEVLAVMRAEGLDYAAEMEDEMFPGRGGEAWQAVASDIYDQGEMEERIARDMEARLGQGDLDPLMDFFTSGLGAEIVALEIEARRALQDESVEEAATERVAQMREQDDDRIGMLDTFVEVNDLVDSNVAGALGANYAFYLGLADGGAVDGAMNEDEMIADVWAREPEIREETLDWVYGYLGLAYQPLSDDELDAYIELGRSDAGQALNSAIFSAFDAMYVDISRELGRSAARFMAGQDI